MNFTNLSINNTIVHTIPPYLNSFENCLFFHMESTGHFWRNSYIKSISILFQNEDFSWTKREWQSEQESDEYDLLLAFHKEVQNFMYLIGFNSTSFHLPYLEQKYKAYGISSPFEKKIHIDQFREIRPIGKELHISTKLNNLRIFFHFEDDVSDVECIAASSALFIYPQIFDGAFSVEQTEQYMDELLFTCKTDFPFPSNIRIHDEEFYLIGIQNSLKIKTKIPDGNLKLYYSNYKDYFYLPEEDMIIHKSLAASISKEKKIKATAENCFSYLPCTENFRNNPDSQKKYLIALLKHYRTMKKGTR